MDMDKGYVDMFHPLFKQQLGLLEVRQWSQSALGLPNLISVLRRKQPTTSSQGAEIHKSQKTETSQTSLPPVE